MKDLPDQSRVTSTLAVVATSNTQTFTYPAGTGPGYFASGGDHKITGPNVTELLSQQGHITITFGASSITVVNNTERTFRAGETLVLDLDLAGVDADEDPAPANVFGQQLVRVYLGVPATLDADGAAAAQAVAAPGNLTLNGALAAAGVVTFDVPRGVQIVSSGAGDTTQTATVTGTDVNGDAVVETIAFNGVTPVLGKKAFKTITRIAISAALAGNGSAGSTDILGLPVFVPDAGCVLKEIQDGAAATAGTLVAGATAVATATTGDVRGTYDPNAAANGVREFELILALTSESYQGVAQFAG